MSANVRTAVKLWVATRTGAEGPRLHVFGLAGLEALPRSWCGRVERRASDVSSLSVLDARLFGGQITHCSSCSRSVRSRYPAAAGRSAWAPATPEAAEALGFRVHRGNVDAQVVVAPDRRSAVLLIDPPCGGGKSEIGGGGRDSARGPTRAPPPPAKVAAGGRNLPEPELARECRPDEACSTERANYCAKGQLSSSCRYRVERFGVLVDRYGERLAREERSAALRAQAWKGRGEC